MPIKRLLVLANSYKRSGRCVAGRELIDGPSQVVGSWIRPISDLEGGELLQQHVPMLGHNQPRVLDVVDVSVIRPASTVAHPEDWIVKDRNEWTRLRTVPAARVQRLVEHPADLWLESAAATQRVSAAFLHSRQQHQSLYLIDPQDLVIESSHPVFDQQPKVRTQAIFVYAGIRYRMSLTDPIFMFAHNIQYPPPGKPPILYRPEGRFLACVSLTPEFHGYHYKVVATIISVP